MRGFRKKEYLGPKRSDRAWFLAVEKVRSRLPDIPGIEPEEMKKWSDSPMILITGHRRESFGEWFNSIRRAIADLSRLWPKVQFVYPVHLNATGRSGVIKILGGDNGLKNVHLIDPLPYLPVSHE